MTWWKDLLRVDSGGPQAVPIGLNAATEATLGNALRQFTPGGRGWIGRKDARLLFSADDDDLTALSEFDAAGARRLGEFAASHRCDAVLEGDRVVFTRKAN
jgi:hypothetical protein